MTVLRSRKVLPPPPTPKSLKSPSNTLPQPSTPSQHRETETHPLHSPPLPSPAASFTDSTPLSSDCVSAPAVSRRRSSRLAAKGLDAVLDYSPRTKLSTEMKSETIDNREVNGNLGIRSICSGVEGLEVNGGAEGLSEPSRSIDFGCRGSKSDEVNVNGKRKSIPTVDSLAGKLVDESPESKECLSLRSGKRVLKTVAMGVDSTTPQRNADGLVEERRGLKDSGNDAIDLSGNGGVVMEEMKKECSRIDKNDCTKSRNRFSRRDQGKWIVDNQSSNGNDTVVLHCEPNGEVLSDNLVDHQKYLLVPERPKEIVIEEGKKLNGAMDANDDDAIEEHGEGKLIAKALLSLSKGVIIDSANVADDNPQTNERQDTDRESGLEEEVQYNIAHRQWIDLSNEFYRRRTALEFARCYNEGNDSSQKSEGGGGEGDIEDWPGPFSTAMKIASDRANGIRVTKSLEEKNVSAPVVWTPRKNKCRSHSQSVPPPPLRDLCLWVLAKNNDAISSLDFVPDAFRHKLGRLLCDSRKINNHILNLLLCGSPTEVCLGDCSWLSEEEFVKSFQGCDTSRLMILQLEQCGRFILDYVLLSTLAQSSNSLPALKSLSLTGAYRLSDVGIAALVSSAPALQDLNLRQCSFLTSSSIDAIANSLGSTLRELYLDDCLNVDPMLMISAMKKLQHLEVLSLAGIGTVCDEFIEEFLTAGGHNLKELILANCVELTNKSVKAITENCTTLRAIDLVNLTRLTDYALCCLAIGCPTLQKLKLSRNLFSDAAVAEFVEISGKNLKKLSLNGVKRVSRGTAISLACFSKNLVSLDLSWCRKLTNEALGLIVDNCQSLRVLKLFGCSQVTDVFLDGHSNPEVEIIGLKLSPVWPHVDLQKSHQAPSDYSSSMPCSD